MSVFIKGIRMPDGCVDCPLSVSINFGVVCSPTGTIIPDSKLFNDVGEPLGRQNWCPIIDVLTEQDLFCRWIPVSERLPEPSIDTWVLGYCPGHDEYRVRSHFDVLHYEKSWWVDIYGHCLGLDYISHWMPLPEGPEEGE